MKSFFLRLAFLGTLASAIKAQESTHNLAYIPVAIGTHLLVNYSLGYTLGVVRQCGPLLAAHLYNKCGAELHSKEESRKLFLDLSPVNIEVSLPEFKNNLLNAIMYGSGPFVGLLACFCSLKLATICHEYVRPPEFENVIAKELSKSIGTTGIKGHIFFHAALNIFDCVPFIYKLPNNENFYSSTGRKVKYHLNAYVSDVLLQTSKI